MKKTDIEHRVKDMFDENSVTDQNLQEKYDVRDNRDWHISEARPSLRGGRNNPRHGASFLVPTVLLIKGGASLAMNSWIILDVNL